MRFKVGDKVKAINAVDDNERIVNQRGTIIIIKSGCVGQYGVEFDNFIDGHGCGCEGKNGYCWWVSENDIVPVKEFKVGEIYKVGDGFEKGNIIKITDVCGYNIRYKTLKNENFGRNWFHINSPFADSLKLINCCDEKIVITTDGTTTTAKLYDGKTVVKTATVKCSPEDEFDFETGAKIAFDKLTGYIEPILEETKCDTLTFSEIKYILNDFKSVLELVKELRCDK